MKILIVDDEPFVREGLKKMIGGMDLDLSLCGEAEDGGDALPLIAAQQPDIVMTDIMMIDMNGLELIRKVTEAGGPLPRFVILSAYDAFDFARQAMRFNVRHYLLKPIDPQELKACLMDVLAEIRAERRQQADARENEKTALQVGTLRFLTDGAAADQAERLRLGWHAPGKATYVCAIVLAGSGGDEDEVQGHAGEALDAAVAGFLADRDEHMVWQAILRAGGRRWILLSAWKPGGKDVVTRLETVLREGFDDVRQHGGESMVALIGEPVHAFSALHEAYGTAVEISDHRYLAGPSDVLVRSRILARNLQYRLDDLPDVNRISDAVAARDVGTAVAQVDELFLRFQASATAPDCIRAYVNEIGLGVMRHLQQANGDVEGFILRHRPMLSFEPRSQSLSDLRRRVAAFCEDAVLCLRALEQTQPGTLVSRVVEYVDKHFREELNVQSIASVFYMNPSYLGQTFKRATGIFLNEFINRRRMEEAKRLLRTTDFKVYQIAGLVGFVNPDYFVSKFVACEGITPLQFRKNP